MMALTTQDEISDAFARLSQILALGAVPRPTTIGWLGGYEKTNVLWHPDAGMWVLNEPERLENRYWIAYGLDDPQPSGLHSISCEINIPRCGVNRRVAATFASDPYGAVYLVHSGKVGGGRRGIGKEAFLADYPDTLVRVTWPDGLDLPYIPITSLSDANSKHNIARFVRRVAEFKDRAVRADGATRGSHQ